MFALQREGIPFLRPTSVRQPGKAQRGNELLGIGGILEGLPAHELRDREVWPQGQTRGYARSDTGHIAQTGMTCGREYGISI